MIKTVCGIVLMFFLISMCNCSYGYSDINTDYWGYATIKELTENEILSGYPDGTFKPDNNISIAEFATILMKITYPEADVSSLSEYWADGVIKLCKDKNIILEGDYSDFNPNRDITRREICLMIYRSILGISNIDIKTLNNRKEFIDISDDNREEKQITAVLSHIGVLSGYPDGTVKLDNNSSRIETCCFINNLMKSRCTLLSVLNNNEVVAYENDIAKVDISNLPYDLKRWNYSKDIPYATTKIKSIELFPFNSPVDRYKELFNGISVSEDLYLQYRKKFGAGNYVIAVEFETTNNTNEFEIYTGSEFLHVSFPDEDISIIDKFDTDEMVRQLNKNANVGELIMPGETLDTSAFYIVDKLPERKIKFDRAIAGLYDINKKQNVNVTSFHSLVVNLESR